MRTASTALLIILTTGLSGSARSVSPLSESGQSNSRPLLVANRVLANLPFSEGEELVYEINWKPIFLFPAFKAGELRMSVRKDSYQDSPAFKISAWASSGGLLKSVAKLDVRDYFESIIDGRDLKSHRFLHRKRQNQTRRDLEITFDYGEKLQFIREVDVSQDPPRQLRDEVRRSIPETVVDTLSVFYAARFTALQPGSLYRIHLSDGGTIKDVAIRVERRERINIAMGRFDAVRISTEGQLFRGGGEFRIWYSTDDLRIPLKFEADVKFGKVYGQILQLQSRHLTRSVIRNQ